MTKTKQTIKELERSAFEALKENFGYKNPMQVPRLLKVVISAGTGSFKDKKKIDVVSDRLTKITGQKPSPRGAKKSIASFKVRQGETVGVQATLRGERMRGFLEKLLNVAFPRTKDFRGISEGSVDGMGNITIGIREHTIFPETTDEELKDVFGMSVTIVTSARTKQEAVAFLRHIGVPFAKQEKGKK
ncbi:MAG: large subunit ribosomal protein L5 [Parcubacteria group bacterium Gr01-1014_72]|nr:MAG: large subunit ribosomal protein L5 [Parcubacteria group bacterium Gr01-1014_72]